MILSKYLLAFDGVVEAIEYTYMRFNEFGGRDTWGAACGDGCVHVVVQVVPAYPNGSAFKSTS